MAAATLTEQQIKRSLVAKKKKAPAVKTVLCSPYVAKWPVIDSNSQQKVLQQLKQFFQDHKCHRNRKKQLEEPEVHSTSSEQNQLRAMIIYGVQQVTRCLERDELDLVVVDRSSPWQLHQHLAQLSAVRHCPALAVDHLASAVGRLLGLPKLSAIGFKKVKDDEQDELHQLIEDIRNVCVCIELPWLNFEVNLQQIQSECMEVEQPTQPIGAAEEATQNVVVDPLDKKLVDYSHLYIYKKPKADKEAAKEDLSEFVSLRSTSSSSEVSDDESACEDDRDSDAIPGVADCEMTESKSHVKTEVKREYVVYQSPNIGVQITNPNKKRKMVL